MTRSRRPKDPNVLAYQIVRQSTEEKPDLQNVSELVPKRTPVSEYLAQIGRKGGLKGGPARKKALSAKKRKEIATIAAITRWKQKRS